VVTNWGKIARASVFYRDHLLLLMRLAAVPRLSADYGKPSLNTFAASWIPRAGGSLDLDQDECGIPATGAQEAAWEQA
jgi:hypothetical protein